MISLQKAHIPLLSDGNPGGTEFLIVEDVGVRCVMTVRARTVAAELRPQAAQQFGNIVTQLLTLPDH